MAQAKSYAQWCEAAMIRDQKTGMEAWKRAESSRLYDYRSIRNRLTKLRDKRTSGDSKGLLFVLNEGIHGNMAGMGNDLLYQRAAFGTKALIEEYVTEIGDALEYLASDEANAISEAEKLDFFQRASHCFGRSALMLSGSGTLFYFHLGVVKSLWEQNLLPRIICGSSGGALIGSLVGTHSHTELEGIFDPEYIRFEVEKENGILGNIGLLRRKPISVDGVKELYHRLIPEMTFQEAQQATGFDLNVSVAPVETHQSSRLLNSIASPNVMVRDAVMASCAFPGFFPAVGLRAKDEYGNIRPYLEDRRWMDGSISDDMPIRRITRLYGVNHFIVSQTNPAALPFINREKDPVGLAVLKKAMKNTTREWLVAGNKLISHPAASQSPLHVAATMLGRVLSQTYTGDINIFPPSMLHNPMSLLSGRSSEEALALIHAGERASWPHIERIRIQTHISRVLDNILRQRDALAPQRRPHTSTPPSARPPAHD
ncbi:DUF3336 domain-containing protein [Spongiibacter sp. KMU-166]|uniref:DUF3336 domain-containing protein n=2 Tax=Spongiibacter thalassae TaxID=2721624 RepID=A0ABX1GCX1_9GAMM|nr:DUF3336 domain-containing protein [Spongiibacter thalassae]